MQDTAWDRRRLPPGVNFGGFEAGPTVLCVSQTYGPRGAYDLCLRLRPCVGQARGRRSPSSLLKILQPKIEAFPRRAQASKAWRSSRAIARCCPGAVALPRAAYNFE